MTDHRRDAKHTKERILDVAGRLFAEHGIAAVSIRDIAKEAGVTHALVHRYFGTKEELIGSLLHQRLNAALEALPPFDQVTPGSFEGLQQALRWALTADGQTTVRLIAQAELEGYEPHRVMPGGMRIVAEMTQRITMLQRLAPDSIANQLDPRIVSMVLGGAIMSISTLGPWLASGVGLDPDDVASQHEEVVRTVVAMVRALAAPAAPNPA